MNSIVKNKSYIEYSLYDAPELFDGVLEGYEVSEEVLTNLAKSLGLSYNFYLKLASLDRETAHHVISLRAKQEKCEDILLLIDEETKSCVNYSLDTERPPILNSNFFEIVMSLLETTKEVSVSESYYHKDDPISYFILKRNQTMDIIEKYTNKSEVSNPYELGIVLINDERYYTYTRIVLYENGQPLYLPASYYNSSTSRYVKSTSSTRDALEVLTLKVIDDLRGDNLYNKLYEFHFKYRAAKQVIVSYEEYSSVLKALRKIPSVIEEPSYIDSFIALGEQFDHKYAQIEDQKSSYLWRCTAMSMLTLESMVNKVADILNNVNAVPIEYFAVRELLGYYISTNRNAVEIAKEDLH